MAEPTRPEQLEREAFLAVVKSAIAKNQAKQPLTPKERRAWQRWEADEDQRRGQRFVAAVPKKVYCDWSGRPTKILHDQCDLYGVPLRGATINVPDVIRWLHEFFAEHKHALAPLVKGLQATGEPLTAKEQLLREQVDLYRKKNELLEDQLAERRSQLIPRGEVHSLHLQLATVLRAAGERLAKQFGAEAASILTVALDDFDALINQLAAPKDDEHASPSGDAPAANAR